MAAPKKKNGKGKAKSSRPEYCALLWGLSDQTEKGGAVRTVLKSLNIPIRDVAPERLGDPAGSLAGLIGFRPAFKPFEGEAPTDEFLMLCNVPKDQTGAFLTMCQMVGAVVDHKCVLTKFNKSWPLVEIMRQVAAEHASMAGDPAEDGAEMIAVGDDAETAEASAEVSAAEAAGEALAAELVAEVEAEVAARAAAESESSAESESADASAASAAEQ